MVLTFDEETLTLSRECVKALEKLRVKISKQHKSHENIVGAGGNKGAIPEVDDISEDELSAFFEEFGVSGSYPTNSVTQKPDNHKAASLLVKFALEVVFIASKA